MAYPPKKVHVSITEVTYVSGRKTKIYIAIDEKNIGITIPVELKAYFDDQFSRSNPSTLQRKKYTTVMNLMKAAYLQGKSDSERK